MLQNKVLWTRLFSSPKSDKNSSSKLNRKRGNAHEKMINDEATIIWTMDHFLEWADSKPVGFCHESPIFSFELGCANVTHNFSVKIYPKGIEGNADTEKLGIYLQNKDTGTITVKARFQFLTKNEKILGTLEFTGWSELAKVGTGWPRAISRKSLQDGGLLPSDSLTIHCNISFKIRESSAVTYETTLLPEKPSKTIHVDFGQMYSDQTFSDFEIVCQGKSFPCHKNVLAARSKVFKTMLNTDSEEAKKTCLVIKDFEIEEVDQMLQFIYTGQLKGSDSIGTDLFYFLLTSMIYLGLSIFVRLPWPKRSPWKQHWELWTLQTGFHPAISSRFAQYLLL